MLTKFCILNRHCTGYSLHSLITWYCWFFTFQKVNCVRKTNIKLFSRLMRRIHGSTYIYVESSFLFHKCCFYFRIFWFLMFFFFLMDCFDRIKSQIWNYIYILCMATNEVTVGPCISDFRSDKMYQKIKNCKKLIAGTAFLVKWTCLLILMNKLNVLVVIIQR